MALSEGRIHCGRATPYPWERQALDVVYKHASLSDTDPHQAWELHELYDPSSGRLYEIDLLFLSFQGLFLVEIKSHPGALTGDIVDWTITEGGRRRTIECPYPGANLKGNVLGDLLERQRGYERSYVHASSEVVRAALVEISAGTPLAALPADQRHALAARASTNAAASARLELYPRGMDATRVLSLSLGALSGTGLTPEVVRKRIAARYPEAAPLPDRPARDALLAAHGLIYAPDIGADEYTRPGQHAHASMTAAVPVPSPTAPGLKQRCSPDAQRAAAFQDQLDRGIAAGRFRVVQARADVAGFATDLLATSLKTTAISLDRVLPEAIRRQAVELGVEWANIEAADGTGPTGPDWPLLLELVRQATERVVDELFRRRHGTLLLAWPGALARYGLAAAPSRVVEGAECGDAPSVLLIVPSHADGMASPINGRMPVPAPLPSQRLVMPDAWLANAHKAAETP